MTKRLVILIVAITGALALPFIAKAKEPSHNVSGEQGVVFHDARSETARSDALAAPRSGQPVTSGWRYVGGEAVWIYESADNRSQRESPSQPGRARVSSTSERPPMQRAQLPNDIYHGA